MKVVLTEDKIYKVISKFMDIEYGDLEIDEGDYSYKILIRPNEKLGIFAWKNEHLYIWYGLITELKEMFHTIPLKFLIKSLIKWVENKFNLEVESYFETLNVDFKRKG